MPAATARAGTALRRLAQGLRAALLEALYWLGWVGIVGGILLLFLRHVGLVDWTWGQCFLPLAIGALATLIWLTAFLRGWGRDDWA